MEEEQLHSLRESTRNVVRLHRRNQRNDICDIRRPISEIRKPVYINEIVNKLKTKSSITASELHTLQNGLSDNAKNVEVFLSTHGALRGLVREISGHDISKRSAAVGCCCNLALGDAKASAVVAKAAGSYLITSLDNLSSDLSITCAWALGNLAASGQRICDLLTSQGALAKLTDLMATRDAEVREATQYALLHFAYSMRDDLRLEYLTNMLQALSKHNFCMTSSQLLFVLSCHNEFCSANALNGTLLQLLLENMIISIKSHVANCAEVKSCCFAIYLIRTLANIKLDDNIYNLFMNCFLQEGVSDVFRKILLYDNDVKMSLLWLLGNIFNYDRSHVLFNHVFR